LINLALLGWFLGRAEGRVVLIMTAVGNLANLGLDYLFIMRWGMEAQGAGLATALSQYLTLAVGFWFWRHRRTALGGWRNVLDPSSTMAMLRLSGDIVVRTVCLTSVFALFTNWSAWLGTGVLAANAILLRVVSTAAYLVDGAAYATESLAGMAHGRSDRGDLARLLRLSLVTGMAFELAVALAVIAAPQALLGLLTSHQDVVARAVAHRWWLLPVMVPGAFAYIYDGFFLGLTAGRILRNAMLVSLFVFVVPAWLAAHAGSNSGLWLALALFMIARSWLLYRASGPFLRSA
jgi:MATE family multidrug resistance protein